MNSNAITRARQWVKQHDIRCYSDYSRKRINPWAIYAGYKSEIDLECNGDASKYETLVKQLVDVLKV